MRKFIVIILFLALTPFYSWAISLEEIQRNPERYVKLNESQSYISYMDVESIHCDMNRHIIRYREICMASPVKKILFLK